MFMYALSNLGFTIFELWKPIFHMLCGQKTAVCTIVYGSSIYFNVKKKKILVGKLN